MPAAPPPADESRRIAALLRCGVLDSPPEADFDDITRLAASICHTPIALVSLVDSARQWFKSRVGLDAQETPREQAFCAHAILGRTPLIIENAATHPLTADNPLVTGYPKIRFYAGVPLRLPSGEALGTLCVIDLQPRRLDDHQVRDLLALAGQAASQLHLRENIHRLEAAEQAANAANAAKSDFIANISHEIRTPLHAILGYAEIIENHLDAAHAQEAHTATAAQAATAVAANAQHLVAIVNDLLDFSKFEAGRFEISPVPTSPDTVIAEAIAIVRPQADKKGVALLARPGPTLPTSLSTDPVRLRQILVNLLANAVKFTAQGSVTLEASYDRPASSLAVRVVDTGIGMSPDQLERIARFEPFNQADASTTRRFGGTGLGLAISQRFATLLGGGIQIHSAQGQGSAFTLTINAAPAEAAHPTAHPAAQPALPVCPGPHDDNAASKPLAARSILVAEDGPDNQRLARYFLERAGASVTIAANGIEAIHAHQAHQAHQTHLARQAHHAPAPPGYDLILMDLQMPEMDGYESTRRLRLAGCASPIIALTANTAHAERQACLDAGCDQFISKPIRGPELVQACVRAIANGHHRRDDTAHRAA